MHKAFIISIVYPPTTPAFSHPAFPEGGEWRYHRLVKFCLLYTSYLVSRSKMCDWLRKVARMISQKGGFFMFLRAQLSAQIDVYKRQT